jgi:hypothetical protein
VRRSGACRELAQLADELGQPLAWVFAFHQLGAASAAYGAGLVRTDAGSYHWAFLAAGALCLGASLASTRIRRLRGVPGISLQAAEARR